jgi:hypothetical protein
MDGVFASVLRSELGIELWGTYEHRSQVLIMIG